MLFMQLKKFIETLKSNNKVTITIQPIIKKTNNIKIINNKNKTKNKDITEKITAEINPSFNSDEEMVIRKTDFVSERTFAINADKAAFELNKDLIGFLKGKENNISVIIENKL